MIVDVSAVWGLVGIAWLGLGVLLSVLVFRDAQRRGFEQGGAVLIAVLAFITIPFGPLVYLVVSASGALDRTPPDEPSVRDT